MFMFIVYRPPHGNCNQAMYKLSRTLYSMYTFTSVEFHVCGDFNINYLDKKSPGYKSLQQLMNAFNLTQLIKDPTRVTETSSTCIDLFLTNRNEIALSAGVVPFGASDHDIIYLQRKLHREKPKARFITVRLFKNFSEEIFMEDILELQKLEAENDENAIKCQITCAITCEITGGTLQ